MAETTDTTVTGADHDDEMLPEYDFSQAAPGNYHDRYQQGQTTVLHRRDGTVETRSLPAQRSIRDAAQARDFSDCDDLFAPFYATGERVEITWKDGMEDYRSYGNRTNGRKARGYIGRSTGVKPVYLLIDNARSLGGSPLRARDVTSIHGLGYTRHGRKVR